MEQHLLLALTAFVLSLSLSAQNTFPSSGNVGIGTTSPQKLLQVKGFGAFGRSVTSANATRALNLADADAVMRVLRVSTTNSPAVELLSRATADGPNLAYWDLSAKPDDKSFRIRDRVGGGSGLDRVTISTIGNMGIGTTLPHASALLDLTSTTKGLLMPRMTLAQRNAITSPATGLLIFQTDNTPGYYYYSNGWKPVANSTNSGGSANTQLSNLTHPTSVNLDLLPNIGGIRDLGSPNKYWHDLYVMNKIYMAGSPIIKADPTNVFFGANAGQMLSTGSGNIGAGGFAMSYTTSGSYNTAMGEQALFNNTTGHNNLAFGHQALFSSTASNDNIAVGKKALFSNDGGYENIALGNQALYYNVEGSENTAVGQYALQTISLNSRYNTAMGYAAGGLPLINSVVSRCTYIGTGTYSANNVFNATAVGSNAYVDGSNKVRIGDGMIMSIGGQVNWTAFSDGRFKRNMQDNVQGLPFINALRPITYTVDVQGLTAYYHKSSKQPEGGHRKADEKAQAIMKESEEKASKIIYSGFVAQEVEKTANKFGYAFSGVDKPQTEGGLYGLRYSDFVVPLVKAVQELSKKTDEIEKLKIKNEELEVRLQKLEALLTQNNNNNALTNLSSAYLEQSSPNPARGNTVIRYSIPDGATSARLTLANSKGQLLKTMNLNSHGAGQVNLETSALPAGVYSYSLLINGKLADAKQLVITR